MHVLATDHDQQPLRVMNSPVGRLAQSQADQGSSPGVPSQGGWDPEPSPQPGNSGWDDEPPPNLAASPGRGRGRGKGASSKGRAGPVAQHSSASEGWGVESSASRFQPWQDGWGFPVSSDPQGKLHLANSLLPKCCSVCCMKSCSKQSPVQHPLKQSSHNE